MMKRPFLYITAACSFLLLGTWAYLAWCRPTVDLATVPRLDRLPAIRPDYCDTVIPFNIAPLHFVVDEPGTKCVGRIRAEQGEGIELGANRLNVTIPTKRWRQFLHAHRGEEFFIDICVRNENGTWQRFQPIVNRIAESEIDNYLCYRLIKPLHTVYGQIDIIERDLRDFSESAVVENKSFGGACVNCHTFAPHDPDRMIVQTRGTKHGVAYSGTIVVHGNEIDKVDTRSLAKASQADRGRVGKAIAAYSAWHPNGMSIAYSANDIFQFFHAVGDVREVFDRESDLALYHVESDQITTCAEISKPDRLETFPTWSPDGRFLYFCAADPLPQQQYDQVRYDLMRIGYDPDQDEWGELETVLRSSDTGRSIAEPRVSPDGKWLLFCMADHGAFPVYQASSDLYLLDIETRDFHRLDVNSPRSESWHSWSSNSRWIAFASKRRDGVFGRIYFSYVDEAGSAHKPVLLPQKDPTLYDRLIKTYSVPELTPFPAPVHSHALGRAIRSLGTPVAPNAADSNMMMGSHSSQTR